MTAMPTAMASSASTVAEPIATMPIPTSTLVPPSFRTGWTTTARGPSTRPVTGAAAAPTTTTTTVSWTARTTGIGGMPMVATSATWARALSST